MMKVVGRAGSQNCAAVSGNFCERGVCDLQVDDQPWFVEHEVFERDAELLPHRAGSAVAADDIIGGDGARCAAIAAQMQRHTVRRLRESG